MPTFMKPRTLAEVMEALRDGREGKSVPFAGGTDLMVLWKRHGRPFPEVVVDLKSVDELAAIAVDGRSLVVGACASLSAIAGSGDVRALCPILAEAAGRVACPQVRNRATIGGNLCNASPAADTALPLIVSDAVLEIVPLGGDGMREVAACDFFTGPGRTVLEPSELLARVRIPLDDAAGGPDPSGGKAGPRGFAAFRKFGTRPAMEIAVASAAVSLTIEKDTVTRARAAFGSVAPVPLRGRTTETVLEGRPLDDTVIATACSAAMSEISPITDVRASEDYRRELIGILLRRMLEDARVV
jgi:CO/xanthine dehydrogenase FAD-binding subunit